MPDPPKLLMFLASVATVLADSPDVAMTGTARPATCSGPSVCLPGDVMLPHEFETFLMVGWSIGPTLCVDYTLLPEYKGDPDIVVTLYVDNLKLGTKLGATGRYIHEYTVPRGWHLFSLELHKTFQGSVHRLAFGNLPFEWQVEGGVICPILLEFQAKYKGEPYPTELSRQPKHLPPVPRKSGDYEPSEGPGSGIYTSWQCMGGDSVRESYMDRTCDFRNICWDPAWKQWNVYRDPTVEPEAVLYDDEDIIIDFPDQFAGMAPWASYADAWTAEFVNTSIPANAVFVDNAPITVLMQMNHVHNPGHYLIDNMHLLFVLVKAWNHTVESSDFQVLSPQPDTWEEKGARFHKSLMPGVSRHYPQFMTDPPYANNAPDAPPVCLKRLLLGVGWYSWSRRAGPMTELPAFRERVLTEFGLICHPVPRKHLILIHQKTLAGAPVDKVRGLANLEEVTDAVRKEFGSDNVLVVAFDGSTTIQQQLELIRSATVIVTPATGAIFIGIFLPPTASIIVLDTWAPVGGDKPAAGSKRFWSDSRMWNSIPGLYSMYYPVRKDEMVYPEYPPEEQSQAKGLMYFHGKVRVDVERLNRMLRVAVRKFEFGQRERLCPHGPTAE